MLTECPVCKRPLRKVVNQYILECPPRKVAVPELGVTVECIHTTAHLDMDGSVHKLYIEILPYHFEINYKKNTSCILVLTRNVKSKWDKSKNKELIWKPLMEFNSIINLPWNNRKAIMDRVKLYLLFS